MNKIIQAIARALAAVAKAPFSLLDWVLGTGGGSGMPAQPPHFEPVISTDDLQNHLRTRRSENELLAHQDAVRAVEKYLHAAPAARATCDLSVLPVPARTALLDMSDAELLALKSAGFSAIRKFADGKAHGIEGVPSVAANANVIHMPTPEERLRERIRLHMAKEEKSEPFIASRQFR